MGRLIYLVIAFCAAGCVTSHPETSQPLAQASVEPAQIASVQAWDGLSKEAKQDIIEGDYRRYKNLSLTARQRLGELAAPDQKAVVEKIAAHMKTNGDMTVEDTSHARVGNVESYVQLLLMDGKQMLGGQISFQEQGCDMPDESAPAFRSASEAEGAGCELGVGFWAAYGTFDHGGAPIEYGDFLEWQPTGTK